MKRKVYLLSILMILGILFLNGILFYAANFSAEYVQSKNVWGETQAIRLHDYQRQAQLLSRLPKDPAEAEVLTEKLVNYLEAQQEIQETLMSKWRAQELSTPPEDLTENRLFLELQAADLANYARLHALLLNVVHYKDYVKTVKDNADGIIYLLYPLGNAEASYSNALQSKRDFSGLDDLVLVPALDNGVNVVLQYHVTDFLALLLLFVISLPYYFYLRKHSLLMAESIHSLNSSLFGFSALGILGLYLSNLEITRRVIGFPSLQIPLQSLEAFYSCPYAINLGEFLLLWLALKLCTLLFLLLPCLLAVTGKHPRIALPLVFCIIGVEFYLSRLPATNPGFDLPREINLFSGITSERFFNRYLNVTFHSQALPRIWVFLLTFTLPFLLLSVLSIRRLETLWENARAALQKVYSEEIDKRYQETRRLWHDFNNHLLTIKALYGTGHEKEAEAYIEKLSEENQKRFLPAKTGSNAVDLLLFQKSQAAREQNSEIRYTISCDLAKHNFQDHDLCSLLGNLLDNATEASVAIKDKTPQIRLRLEERGSMLFIMCENEFFGELSKKGESFLTTKKDAAHHGLGLTSVKQICNKYGGTMETLVQGEIFRITILLNDKKS